MYIKRFIIIRILLITFVTISATLIMLSCKNNRISEEDIMNTKISISLDSMLLVNETLKQDDKLQKIRYRFVSYLDSASCTRCEMYKMGMWKRLEKITMNTNIQYIFIYKPPKEKVQYMKDEYIQTKQKHLLYFDTLGLIESKNPIISKSVFFHNFLLDENNNVIFVGNPSKNEMVRRKYLDFVHSLN